MAFRGCNRVASPCYRCEKRTVGCHSTCEPYIAFAEARKADVFTYDPVAMMYYDKKGSKKNET